MISMYIYTIQPITFKSPIPFKPILSQIYSSTILNSTSDKAAASIQLSLSNYHRPPLSLRFSNSAAGEAEDRLNEFSGVEQYNVATLGNLCVDVVLSVPSLPHDSLPDRENYMNQLSKSPPYKILFCNGYGFDKIPPDLIVCALEYAVEVGKSIFFDPVPRGKTLATGTPEHQRVLSKLLSISDVLLLTSEEAESLTNIGNPIIAGQELLKKGVRTKWVIIKMGLKGSVLITKSSISCAPAFKDDHSEFDES